MLETRLWRPPSQLYVADSPWPWPVLFCVRTPEKPALNWGASHGVPMAHVDAVVDARRAPKGGGGRRDQVLVVGGAIGMGLAGPHKVNVTGGGLHGLQSGQGSGPGARLGPVRDVSTALNRELLVGGTHASAKSVTSDTQSSTPSRRSSAAVLACARSGVMLARSEARSGAAVLSRGQQTWIGWQTAPDTDGLRRTLARSLDRHCETGHGLDAGPNIPVAATAASPVGAPGAGPALPPEATGLVIRAAAPAPRRIHTGPRTVADGSEDPTVSAPHSALSTDMSRCLPWTPVRVPLRRPPRRVGAPTRWGPGQNAPATSASSARSKYRRPLSDSGLCNPPCSYQFAV